MRKLLLILLAAIALFATPINSQAGFIIKKTPAAAENTQVVSTMPAATKLSKKEQRKEAIKAIKRLINDNGHPGRPHRHGSSSGWEGIAALVCGILGFVGLFIGAGIGFLCIPAIIFGAIGMGRGHEHRGMALAGFILGVATIVLAILAVVILVSLLSGL